MSSIPTSSILVNTFSPSSIQGLALWYDMYNLDYIQLEGGSCIISTLIDKSGNNYNASSFLTTNSERRIFYLNNSVLNGAGSLSYNETITNTFSNTSFLIPVATRESWSWFALIKTGTLGSSIGTNWFDGRGIIDGYVPNFNISTMGMSLLQNGRLACGVGGTLNTTIESSTITDGNFQLCEFLRYNDNGLMHAYTNGQNFASTFGSPGTRIGPSTLNLGCVSTSLTGNNIFMGSIYEVLMFSTFLSSIERQQVEGYLAWKWGFSGQLPLTHPYRTNPYIVAPDSTPTVIPKNIFLINVDTYSSIKTLLFPPASEIPGRMIVLKDYLGYANRNHIYISTHNTDKFQGLGIGPFKISSNAILSSSYGSWTFQNDGISNWFVTSEYNNTLAVYSTDPQIYPSGPKVFMDPATSTFFPSFNAISFSSFPTNMGSYLNFAGSHDGNNSNSLLNGQWITFGNQQFNMSTNGFAAKVKIMWTNYARWSKVFDFFQDVGGISDMFLTLPDINTDVLQYQYTSSSVQRITQVTSNIFSLYSTFNITVNYLANVGPFGTTELWIDGIKVAENPIAGAVATDRLVSTTLGRSSYTNDQLLCARIYKFAAYDRSLSQAECAYNW